MKGLKPIIDIIKRELESVYQEGRLSRPTSQMELKNDLGLVASEYYNQESVPEFVAYMLEHVSLEDFHAISPELGSVISITQQRLIDVANHDIELCSKAIQKSKAENDRLHWQASFEKGHKLWSGVLDQLQQGIALKQILATLSKNDRDEVVHAIEVDERNRTLANQC
jgi:hypothetical protein